MVFRKQSNNVQHIKARCGNQRFNDNGHNHLYKELFYNQQRFSVVLMANLMRCMKLIFKSLGTVWFLSVARGALQHSYTPDSVSVTLEQTSAFEILSRTEKHWHLLKGFLELPCVLHHGDKILIAVDRGADSAVVVNKLLQRDLWS